MNYLNPEEFISVLFIPLWFWCEALKIKKVLFVLILIYGPENVPFSLLWKLQNSKEIKKNKIKKDKDKDKRTLIWFWPT